MKISIASYAFHGLLHEGKMDIFGYLESCKYRYHVTSADIWTGFFPTIEDDFIKKVKQGLDERDLVLANLCIDGPHLWEDDPAVREKNYQTMLAYLRVAEMLGAKTVRIDAGGRGEEFTAEQFDFIVSRYCDYAKRAHDLGFKIGPENHWGPEVKPETMKRICDAVNHPAFGVLLHFRGNAGDAVIAPYAMHTHISWDIAMSHLEESVNMLRAVGYQGYYSIEHHSGENEYTRTEVQTAKVREYFSRI
jgi:sugar phosphate isomerase/epimerase